ncbi:MAG: ATP-binding protein [Methyloprofundus sp.]|nr:ATP-binding protein [Methyloprofundus sp.]
MIFEYQRHEQLCSVAIYASPNDEGLCYRFIDKHFDVEDFIEEHESGDSRVVRITHLQGWVIC